MNTGLVAELDGPAEMGRDDPVGAAQVHRHRVGTDDDALGDERLEQLGAELLDRKRELARSGGIRLIIRLKRATLRVV